MPYLRKEDQAASSKKHYEANKEKIKARSKIWSKKQRIKNREFIKEFKSKNPCVDCGESNPLVLDFDHVRGEKKRNISDMAHACCSIDTILEEMEKCDIRCSNCHRIATYNRKKNELNG